MLKNNYIINIDNIYDKELARTCKRGISFNPERHAEIQYKQELNFLNVFKDELFQYIKNENEIPFYIKTMDYFIDRYIKEINISNQKHSRILSPMITGPANFKPTTKANNSYEKHIDLILELPNKTKTYYLKHLKKIRTHNAGGEVKQKQAQIIELQNRIEKYKFINKICRSIKTTMQEKINIIKESHQIHESIEKEIINILNGDYKKNTIFAGYQLTSLNNKIKRLQHFIKRNDIIQAKIKTDGTGTKTIAKYKDGEVIQDLETQRINILFPDKPTPETIQQLKSHGFRWSPRFNTWTRKLTNNALYNLKLLLNNYDNK